MKALLLLACAALALAGCGHDQQAAAKFSKISDQMAATQAPQGPTPVIKSKRVYLGDNHVDSSHGDPLPDRFETPQGFIFTTPPAGEALTLAALVQRISAATGLNVLADSQAAPSAQEPPRLDGDSTIDRINSLIGDQIRGASPVVRTVKSYRGPLSEFLARELPGYGVDYDVQGTTILCGKTIVRSYWVVDFDGKTTLAAGLSGASGAQAATSGGQFSGGQTAGGSGAQGTGLSGQSSSTSSTIDSLSDLISALKAYTGADGAVFPEKATGVISVRCPSFCQAQVKRHIDWHNREAGRQVIIALTVLTVTKNGSDRYGFDPTLIYNNLPKGYSFSVLGQAAAATSGAATVSAGIVNPPAGSSAAKLAGSSIALQALSSDSELAVKMSKQGMISNNHPWSVRNALDYSYPSTINNALNGALAQSTLSLTTTVIGDQLQVTPRILPNGYIRLEFAFSQTSIQSTSDYTLDGTTTKVPQLNDNSESAREFTIPDGATLILSDIASETSERDRSGTGSLNNWLLGGSNMSTNNRTRTIVVISAREWRIGEQMAGMP